MGCRNKVDKSKLTAGTRVALDMTTLTIMRMLPREVGLPVIKMLPAGALGACWLSHLLVCVQQLPAVHKQAVREWIPVQPTGTPSYDG